MTSIGRRMASCEGIRLPVFLAPDGLTISFAEPMAHEPKSPA
jgi:hypothetical protein